MRAKILEPRDGLLPIAIGIAMTTHLWVKDNVIANEERVKQSGCFLALGSWF